MMYYKILKHTLNKYIILTIIKLINNDDIKPRRAIFTYALLGFFMFFQKKVTKF